MDLFLQDSNSKISQTIEHLKHELSAIRAGRANPALIEGLIIDAYGGKMKLVELGTISAPQPTLLSIQVWDASVIQPIEKAIFESTLGLTPSTEGTVIRLPIPPLSAERREEFAKTARLKGEEAKITLRKIRAEARSTCEDEKQSGQIGEDEFFKREKLLQALLDRSSAEIDDLISQKEADLRQV